MAKSQFELLPLFAYGTLTLDEVLEAIFVQIPLTEPARALGYGLCALDGLPYPGLAQVPGATANGLLLTLTFEERCLLDDYEDDFLDLTEIGVTNLSGMSLRALAYVVEPSLEGPPWVLPPGGFKSMIESAPSLR